VSAERSRIEKLARAVAEGVRVDWDLALSGSADSNERRAIEQLRAVDALAHGGASPDGSVGTVTRTVADVITSLAGGRAEGQRYRIQAFLGRGGMGEVWHAFDLKLRVDVALKTLLPEQRANERMLERLRREVRSAREVVSPNVCRIFDLIEIGDQELVSMEYIDGTTLLAILRERGPLELREAGEIAAQFLAGLEAIHQAGLIHRDVKPENVMITRSGRVVLMDFGLAKPESERAGTIAGTPAYMAPEQMRGEALDARADIFAAGVALALALEEITFRVEGAELLRPYPGLASFTENDAEYFFGREAEIEALWKKLRRPHLLAVIGPSGAGKSSFLRAGLIPAMPEGCADLVKSTSDQVIRSAG
jgi:serine/threonine protein kinase